MTDEIGISVRPTSGQDKLQVSIASIVVNPHISRCSGAAVTRVSLLIFDEFDTSIFMEFLEFISCDILRDINILCLKRLLCNLSIYK